VLGLGLLLSALTIGVVGPGGSLEYLPLRLAEAEGLFAAQGAAVTLRSFPSEAAAAEALGRGQVDLAATSVDAALRLGQHRGSPPRLVAALTIAPPVALLVGRERRAAIREPADLAGQTVAIPAPGTPEAEALAWLLDLAGVGPPRTDPRSFGPDGAASALAGGKVAAAMLAEPWASRLLDAGAVALVDLRRPEDVARWLGPELVHAAVFARADRALGARELAPLRRALRLALQRLREAPAEGLAAALPAAIVGPPEEWAPRLAGARRIFAGDGRVQVAALERAIALARRRAPLPYVVDLPRRLERLIIEDPE
jgi:ABC-type nitrate/sulfonate/bicarbonate transport system substrate-binding protein